MPAATSSSSGLLQSLRMLFLAFALAPIYIGVAAFFVVGEFVADDGPNIAALGGVGAAGLATLFISRIVGPQLDGSDEAALVGTYRTRFFLRLAFADAAMLVGFVAAVLAEEFVPFLVGAAFTVVGLLRVAPTDGNIARDQEALNQAGSLVNLRNVLTEATPQAGRN